MAHWTFIVGGARSGKSRYALQLAKRIPGKRVFLATAAPGDREMAARIEAHRRERGTSFVTYEEQVELLAKLKFIPGSAKVVVVDCLTLWMSNLMLSGGGSSNEIAFIQDRVRELILVKDRLPFRIIWVSNEVGCGIVPGEPLSRMFQDLLGWTNQQFAEASDRIVQMVAGIPVEVRKRRGKNTESRAKKERK